MSDEKYLKNYLNEVIFQIRFSPILQLYTDEKCAAADFQNIIGKEFPDVEFQHNMEVSFTVDNAGKPVESNDELLTWIFADDKKWVGLNGRELVLRYSGEVYNGFEGFLSDVRLILNGLSEYPINKITSIGLGYVNQINKNLVNQNLHLINNHEEVIQSVNRTELKIDDYNLTFQYGQFNPENQNKEFILDYNCILKNEVKIENIIPNLNKMHDIILERFESDIEDKTGGYNMQCFADSSKTKNTNKKFKEFNIDTSHYRTNSPRIIKSISIDF